MNALNTTSVYIDDQTASFGPADSDHNPWLARVMAQFSRLVADCNSKSRSGRVEFEDLLALDSHQLRDIGLDRPRVLSAPLHR